MDKCDCLSAGGKWKNKKCVINKKKRFKLLIKYSLAGLALMGLLLLANFITGKDVTLLTIFSVAMASIIVFFDKKNRQLYAMSGLTAMIVDFVYEFVGTTINHNWSYVSDFMIPGTQVPWNIPIVYLGLGIMFAAFVKYFDRWLD